MSINHDLYFAAFLDSPWTALLGFATIVPVAIWFVSSISWMVMGDMEPIIGIPTIIIAFGLAFVAMSPPSPGMSPIAFASTLGMVIVYPVVKRQMENRESIRFEIDEIDKAYSMIKQKPDQAYLKFKLAEGLYRRGMVAQACAIAGHALQQMPKGLFPDEHRAVTRWTHHQVGPPEVPCMQCGATNRPGEVFCSACGAPYLADYARGKWLGSNLAARLIAAWVAAVVSLVGVPSVIALKFSPLLSGTLIGVQLAVCGLVVWVAFIKKEKSAY